MKPSKASEENAYIMVRRVPAAVMHVSGLPVSDGEWVRQCKGNVHRWALS